MKLALEKDEERIINSIMYSINERCNTKEEINLGIYIALDLLYEIYTYDTYQEMFNIIQKRIDDKYEIFII